MRYSRSVIFIVLVFCSFTKVFCDPYECNCRSGRRFGSITDGAGGKSERSSEVSRPGDSNGDGPSNGAGNDRSSEEGEKGDEHCDVCEPANGSQEDSTECAFDTGDDGESGEYETIAATQCQNKKLINRAILWGINQVCKVELDNPVLTACGDGEIDKILLTLTGVGGNRTCFPISEMNRLERYKDIFKSKNVTYVIVTGWPVSNHLNPVDEFAAVGMCRPDVAAIIMDVGRNLPMVYNTLNNNSEMIAYLIYRLIKYLFCIGLEKRNTVFVGASIGAQILAMGMTLLNKDCKHSNDKLEKFIGLDPTCLCKGANYITEDIANQVVILHGDGERYGVKKCLGTIDIYPNGGVGYQPGCDSYQCSHVRPMQLFVEAVCNPNSIICVKCRSWKDFTKGRCVRGEKFDMLNMPVYSRGVYYLRTGKHPNYGLGLNGVVPYREFCFD